MATRQQLTKEEKERLIDEKMASMRKMNAVLEQRHKEIEDDKKEAVQHSSTVQMKEVTKYIMKSTPRDRPRPLLNKEVGQHEALTGNAHLSQKLEEDTFPPPPDPTNTFLFDPERDSVKITQTERKRTLNGKGNNNYRGKNQYRGSKNSTLVSETDNSSFNRDNEGFNSSYYNISPRANYRGGRRFNYNWKVQSPTYSSGKGPPSSDQDKCSKTDIIYGNKPTPDHWRKQTEYESWKREQDRYDQQRIARARKGDGQWTREWDSHKAGFENTTIDVKGIDQDKKQSIYAQYLFSKSPISNPKPKEEHFSVKNQYYQIDSHTNANPSKGCDNVFNHEEPNEYTLSEEHVSKDSEMKAALTTSNMPTANLYNEITCLSKVSFSNSAKVLCNSTAEDKLSVNLCNTNEKEYMHSANIKKDPSIIAGITLSTEDSAVNPSSAIINAIEDSTCRVDSEIESFVPLISSLGALSLSPIDTNKTNTPTDASFETTSNDSRSFFEQPTSLFSTHSFETTPPQLPDFKHEVFYDACFPNISAEPDVSLHFSLIDAVKSEHVSSETSSVYEPADEEFPSSATIHTVSSSTSESSYMTAIKVPGKNTSESAFVESEVRPETVKQLDLPEPNVSLEISSVYDVNQSR